jgi:preprotein translocase subunit SecG
LFYEILLGSEQLQITRKRRQNNMKKRTILLAFIISAVAMTSGCSANEPKTDEVKQEQTKTESVSSGVTIKPLT